MINLTIEQMRKLHIMLIACMAVLAIIALSNTVYDFLPFWLGLVIVIIEYLMLMVVVWLAWMKNKMLLEGLTRLYLPEDD